MANTLNDVIKSFKKLISSSDNDLIKSYYSTIVEYLILESKYEDLVKKCGKPIFHYFQYQLPMGGNDYFLFLYNVYSPVRFAVETFDSIEEIRLELLKKKT